MKKHVIKCHHGGDTICVRSDTGEIYYFIVVGDKIRLFYMESVYSNKIRERFKPGKMKEKVGFTLNSDAYDKVAVEFYTRKFMTSNKLPSNK